MRMTVNQKVIVAKILNVNIVRIICAADPILGCQVIQAPSAAPPIVINKYSLQNKSQDKCYERLFSLFQAVLRTLPAFLVTSRKEIQDLKSGRS